VNIVTAAAHSGLRRFRFCSNSTLFLPLEITSSFGVACLEARDLKSQSKRLAVGSLIHFITGCHRPSSTHKYCSLSFTPTPRPAITPYIYSLEAIPARYSCALTRAGVSSRPQASLTHSPQLWPLSRKLRLVASVRGAIARWQQTDRAAPHRHCKATAFARNHMPLINFPHPHWDIC
jgi:hypothetical protein